MISKEFPESAKNTVLRVQYSKYVDLTDRDFVNFRNQVNGPFNSGSDKQRMLIDGLDDLDPILAKNYLFKNQKNLTFENLSESWSDMDADMSNGAIIADLDNDGDLDIVTNRINQPVSLLENKTNSIDSIYQDYQ